MENRSYLNEIRSTVNYFYDYLLKRWWLFVLAIFFGGLLGFIFYLKQKPKYVAVCTFILEEKSASGGGLAGLASQFGLNLGSLGGGGSIFAGDNILEILKSKKVVQQVLLSNLDENIDSGKTLADHYMKFRQMKKNWQGNPQLKTLHFSSVNKKISPVQDSVLNLIYESVIRNNLTTERTSKQGTIIKVQITAEDGLFARLMTERLVDEASRLYLSVRTGTGQDNIMQLQRRSDSLLALLNNKSYRAAASQPLDINPGIRTAVVPVEIANRDKTVLATLYAEVTKNLEASKLLLSQQTPVIQLLDRPGILLPDTRKSIMFFVAVGVLALSFCYILGAFGFFVFNPKTNVNTKSNL